MHSVPSPTRLQPTPSPHSSHLPRRATPHTLPCPSPTPLYPPTRPPTHPQITSLREERNRPRRFFFCSPNSKIYFNCCNTVDYKQVFRMTEHGTDCIQGTTGAGAGSSVRRLLGHPLLVHLSPAMAEGQRWLLALAASTGRRDEAELGWLRD